MKGENMKCKKCGEEVRAGAGFCGTCGGAVSGGNRVKYYAFTAGLVVVTFVMMGLGMKKMMLSGFENIFVCAFDSKCMLYNVLGALITMSFANYFIFMARLEGADMVREERFKTAKGFAGIGILLCAFVFWEVLYITVMKGVRGFAGLAGALPEIGAVLGASALAWYFFYKARLMKKMAEEYTAPKKKPESAPAPPEAVEEVDDTFKLILKIIFAGTAVIYLIIITMGIFDKSAPANFPLQLYVLMFIMYLFPLGMVSSIITAVVGYIFQQLMIKQYYPELHRLESEFNPIKYYEKRKEVRALYKQDHPVLGPYNRIIRRAIFTFLSLLALIIPFGLFMNSVGNSLGFWK